MNVNMLQSTNINSTIQLGHEERIVKCLRAICKDAKILRKKKNNIAQFVKYSFVVQARPPDVIGT